MASVHPTNNLSVTTTATTSGPNNSTNSANNGHLHSANGTRMPKYNRPAYNENIFLLLFFVTQFFGLFMLSLIVIWTLQFYNGFGWANHGLRFNFHPMLMVLGMVYCAGNGLLVFRVLKFVPKKMVKIIHASIHISAFLFAFIGSIAVFTNHFAEDKPNLYSLHSWIGFATMTFFFCQYVAGFAAFLFPTASDAVRSTLLPYHVLGGFAIFGLAIMSSLTGFAEKMAFDIKNYSNFSGRMWVLNLIGILLISFAMLVFYLGTERSYKRHAVGEQLPLTQTFGSNNYSNSNPTSPDDE